MVDMQSVESSNIQAIGYDEAAEELHVQFNNGTTYVYQKVPPELHASLMNAPSKGSFLNRQIKGSFEFSRLN
ncbi:MAG: KTSC domain-containing protein [Planctomycetaceae bacterium]|nr:KTSC domain-containing protein [Planctomycetaceae bacterium]